MFLADSDILQALADMYRTAVGNLPSVLTNVVSQAHAMAYLDIQGALANRGYDPITQIPLWDFGAAFERQQSIYWCLVNSGENVNYGPLSKQYDRRVDLKTVAFSINSKFVAPAAADTPGDIGVGDRDTSRDIQDYNTIDPRLPENLDAPWLWPDR